MKNHIINDIDYSNYSLSDRKYFILFGPPRSGTTILNERVARSLAETQFPEVDHIVNAIINYKTTKNLPIDRLYRFFEKDAERIREAYKEVVRVLLKPCFQQTKEYITLKNPFWGGYIPETVELFKNEDAKFIATVRHPLDLVASWKIVQKKQKLTFDLSETIEFFSVFLNQIIELEANTFKNCDNFMICKYEDFVSGKNKKELEGFLGNGIDLLAPSRMDWSSKLDERLQPFVTPQYAKGINTKSVNNYIGVLDENEVRIVTNKMANLIEFFNYGKLQET